jgi:DegT/DnrJ/EryC1/StrS aminotransferase family
MSLDGAWLVAPSASVRDALETITKNSNQAAMVVDHAGRLIDGDIRRGLLRGVSLDGRVGDIRRCNECSADDRAVRHRPRRSPRPHAAPASAATSIRDLNAEGVQVRPLWHPLHRQPPFRGARVGAIEVADRLWDRGLCLPSSVGITAEERQTVIDALVARLA